MQEQDEEYVVVEASIPNPPAPNEAKVIAVIEEETPTFDTGFDVPEINLQELNDLNVPDLDLGF